MTSDGVALGTVLAQYSGLIIAIALFAKKYRKYLEYFSFSEILNLSKLRTFYKVNSNIFIRTLALLFVLSFFTAESAKFGDDILAANTILLQMWISVNDSFNSYVFMAFIG